MIATQILIAWLLADFITGIVHWIEDRYMDATHSLEFARGIATDNILHHDEPAAMCKNTPWENMRSAAVFAWPAGFAAWYCGAPLWLWLGLTFSAFGNLIHRFAHLPKRDVPRIIRAMQELGLFISAKHHATHHYAMGNKTSKANANAAYCPMTDWVNPFIDRLRLWKWLEWALSWIGIKTIDKRLS